MGVSNFLRRVKLRVRSKKGGQDNNEQTANTTALSDATGCSKVDQLGQSQQNPHDHPEPRTDTEPQRSSTHSQTQNASPCVTEPPQPPASSTGSRSTLWSSAYEALQQKNPRLVDRYEEIVFKEFEKQDPSATGMQGLVQQHDDQHQNENRINTNPSNRYDRLKIITERGLQRAKDKQIKYTIFGHELTLREQADNATKFMLTMKGFIDQAVKVSPEASIAWAGVCALLPIFMNPHAATEANRSGLSYVTSRLEYYVELEGLLRVDELRPELNAEFHSHIVDLYQLIIEFQIETVLQFYRNSVAQVARDAIRYDNWEEMNSKIQKQEKIIQEELGTLQGFAALKNLRSIYDAARQHYAEMESLMKDLLDVSKKQLDVSKKQRDFLEKQWEIQHQTYENQPLPLPIVHEACYDSEDVRDSPRCETGTRTRIREIFHEWANDDSGEFFFWLEGPAGSGKSTIARTIAKSFDTKQQVAAGYFFKRGEKGRNDISYFFPTLAFQMAKNILGLEHCLRVSIGSSREDEIKKKSLEKQFDMLIKSPIEKMQSIPDKHQTPRVIIIDALDECEQPNKLSLVIELLATLRNVGLLRLRVLFTSRFTREVELALQYFNLREKKIIRTLSIHREFSKDTKTDIQTYLKAKFADIKKERQVHEDPWPSHKDLDRMVRQATDPEPLFIYAATLYKLVHGGSDGGDPKMRLSRWFEQCDYGMSQLSQIYDPIFSQAFSGKADAEIRRPKRFLDALILLATPLSLISLTALLGMSVDNVSWSLSKFHAVLNIPSDNNEPIRLYHKSFSDFLLDANTSTAKPLVDAAQTHRMLAEKCIERMKVTLKQDICHLRRPDISRDEIDPKTIVTNIPIDLQYACLYWVYHLQQGKGSLSNDIYEFLGTHLLHWLEVLALLGKVSDGSAAMKQLRMMCMDLNGLTELHDLVQDAGQVIEYFSPIIEQTPLQTYAALLLFSPATSKVRKSFWSQRLQNLPRVYGVKSHWNAQRQTLESHTDSVWAVAFSPDGQAVASASKDNTIRLWDAATGAQQQILEGHIDWVTTVAFSPDSQVVASASYDNTIRLWDAATGAQQQILEGHIKRVRAVAFSPDGQVVASASFDNTIRLWDAATGAQQQTLEGHTSWVTAVAFSPDGQVVASASGDHTIRLWDAATGAQWQTLKGHIGWVTAVAFSPDGQVVASASGDHTIRLWDASTGAQQQTLEGHTSWVIAVAFSPDGQAVASASKDDTIRLWDAATGAQRQTLSECCTRNLAFDPCFSTQLFANVGAMDINPGFWVGEVYHSPYPKRKEMASAPVSYRPSIKLRRSWIMEGKNKVIRLPNEYSPAALATKGSVMSIGTGLGRVITVTRTHA